MDLQGDARKRFAEISTELASLANHFEQNLLDATNEWYMDLKDESDLAGLPDSAKALAKQTAELADVDGGRLMMRFRRVGGAERARYADANRPRRHRLRAVLHHTRGSSGRL